MSPVSFLLLSTNPPPRPPLSPAACADVHSRVDPLSVGLSTRFNCHVPPHRLLLAAAVAGPVRRAVPHRGRPLQSAGGGDQRRERHPGERTVRAAGRPGVRGPGQRARGPLLQLGVLCPGLPQRDSLHRPRRLPRSDQRHRIGTNSVPRWKRRGDDLLLRSHCLEGQPRRVGLRNGHGCPRVPSGRFHSGGGVQWRCPVRRVRKSVQEGVHPRHRVLRRATRVPHHGLERRIRATAGPDGPHGADTHGHTPSDIYPLRMTGLCGGQSGSGKSEMSFSFSLSLSPPPSFA